MHWVLKICLPHPRTRKKRTFTHLVRSLPVFGNLMQITGALKQKWGFDLKSEHCVSRWFFSLWICDHSQVFDMSWSLNEDSNIGNAILFSMIIPNTFKGTVSKCVPKLQLHFVFYWMCVHFEWYSNCNPNCIVEVMGLNPVGASEYFLGFICNCF